LKQGDSVRVYPHGKPNVNAVGTIILISSNQRSIAVGFGEKPPFAILKNGITIHREFGVTLIAMRYGVGPWVEIYGGGHYEIEDVS